MTLFAACCRRAPFVSRRIRAAIGVPLGIASCVPPADTQPSVEPIERQFAYTAMACDDARNVFVAGTEYRDRRARIFVAASHDQGESWPQRLAYVSDDANGDRGRPQVVVSRRGEVAVLWEDTRDGPVHLYINRSRDAGATWMPLPVRVNSTPSRVPGISTPRLVTDGYDGLCVVWLDDREGFEAFYGKCSRDGGETWPPHDVRITSVALGRKSAPSVASDERGGVYVAWMELRGRQPVVAFAASRDRGESWSFDEALLGAPGAAAERILPPAIEVLESGVVIVAWTQIRDGSAEVLLNRSEDRGNTWLPAPTHLASRMRGLFNPSAPLLGSDGRDHVYLAWQAITRDGRPVIVVKSSADRGRTFFEVRLPRQPVTDPLVFEAYERNRYLQPFRMRADGVGNLYFTWVDNVGGMGQVGFDRISQHGRTHVAVAQGPYVAGYTPTDLEPPNLCADTFGHVYVLWNTGNTLTAAASPFYGESGWRYAHF